ncbi:hypothetical protein ACWDX6_24185 [Streptomyces sp. NPDC003027]
MSIRRLRILIDHLPPESATKTAIRNAIDPRELEAVTGEYRPDQGQWSGVEMLLASVKDEVTKLRLVAIAAAGGKPPDFKPTPRPGIPPTSSGGRKRLSTEQRRALDPRLRTQPQEA